MPLTVQEFASKVEPLVVDLAGLGFDLQVTSPTNQLFTVQYTIEKDGVVVVSTPSRAAVALFISTLHLIEANPN